jgi:hypothetical protein
MTEQLADMYLEKRTLKLRTETKSLNAYLWEMNEVGPVYFIFADNDLHIITLEEDETPFNQVQSTTQRSRVQTLSTKELLQLREDLPAEFTEILENSN